MCIFIYLRETNGKKYANWFNLNIEWNFLCYIIPLD